MTHRTSAPHGLTRPANTHHGRFLSAPPLLNSLPVSAGEEGHHARHPHLFPAPAPWASPDETKPAECDREELQPCKSSAVTWPGSSSPRPSQREAQSTLPDTAGGWGPIDLIPPGPAPRLVPAGGGGAARPPQLESSHPRPATGRSGLSRRARCLSWLTRRGSEAHQPGCSRAASRLSPAARPAHGSIQRREQPSRCGPRPPGVPC